MTGGIKKTGFHHVWRFSLAGLLLVCQVCLGCTERPSKTQADVEPTRHLDTGGFSIPVFSSAMEQLNYAKTLSFNPAEKRAALKVLIDRFSDDRARIGEAKLELAYMHLGDDFRLAPPAACRQALAAYESIAGAFADLPAVRAKAYWYMGWIYTDLLKENKRGLAIYSLLAEKYPEDRFSRISPVPWLKMIFPNPKTKPYTADDEHTHSWAGLALLEIVRNATDDGERQGAFEKLWQEHRNSLTTGYALKEILGRPPFQESLPARVDTYVQANTINAELNRDLLSALARWRSLGKMH